MHEQSLITSLLRKIHELSAEENKIPVAATIQLGALAHISASHLREHFELETAGTPLWKLQLHIEEITDIHCPNAQDIVLASLEFEDGD